MWLSRLSAPWLMVGSSFSFACMGLCVKLSSAHHGLAEIVFYRGFLGALIMAALMHIRGAPMRTPLPWLHFKRSVFGVGALSLLFYAVSHLPLATAMTLNYLSSIWISLFVMLSAFLLRRPGSHFDPRLLVVVLMGFGGVTLVLRPTLDDEQIGAAIIGLVSSVMSATAYLQVAALGRAGEPEDRVVLYFSIGGAISGLLMMPFGGAINPPTVGSLLALLGAGAFATSAQLLLTRAYSIGKPMVNASLHYLGIAFSFVFGVVLFDDPVTSSALIGMGLIVMAGLTASQLKRGKNRSAAEEFPRTLQFADDFPRTLQLDDDPPEDAATFPPLLGSLHPLHVRFRAQNALQPHID